MSHFTIYKMRRLFHRLGVKLQDCSPMAERVIGWVQPVWLWTGYFPSLEFWFPHPQNEDRNSTYFMRTLKGLLRTEMKHLVSCKVGQESWLCDCHFLSSFLFFLLLSASQINTSFGWPSNAFIIKTQPRKSFWWNRQRPRGGSLGSLVWTKYRHGWGTKLGQHAKYRAHTRTLPRGTQISFDKRIYSQPFTSHYHNVLPYLHYSFQALISIIFFFKSTHLFFYLNIFKGNSMSLP